MIGEHTSSLVTQLSTDLHLSCKRNYRNPDSILHTCVECIVNISRVAGS